MTRHPGTTPEILAIPRHVQAHGYTATIGRSHHWRITDPAARFVLALPLTAGSRRAAATTHQAFRHVGVPPMPATRHKAKPHREQLVSS